MQCGLIVVNKDFVECCYHSKAAKPFNTTATDKSRGWETVDNEQLLHGAGICIKHAYAIDIPIRVGRHFGREPEWLHVRLETSATANDSIFSTFCSRKQHRLWTDTLQSNNQFPPLSKYLLFALRDHFTP